MKQCSLHLIDFKLPFPSVSGVDHLVDGLFNFAANLQALQLTDEQLALLCAIALISYGKNNLYQVTILNIDPLFLDRSGLKSPSSVQNLQNTMLKALNLNILMEHQHKNYELDAKIRFLECLKRLQGNQLVLTQLAYTRAKITVYGKNYAKHKI